MNADDHETLRRLSLKLEPVRRTSRIAYDMFYAAHDLANLADLLVEDSTKTDFPGRAEQEIDDAARIRRDHGAEIEANPDYATVMRLGALVIDEAKNHGLDPDGHLGFVRQARQAFAFVEHEHGFRFVQGKISQVDYESDQLYLTLLSSLGCYGPVELKIKADPRWTYDLDQIMFAAGRRNPLIAPKIPDPQTQEEVQALVADVAAKLCAYGEKILSGDREALAQLVERADEREQLLTLQNERLWEAEHGRKAPTFDPVTGAMTEPRG